MPIDFTAIDFETANHSPASACAVGMVKVRGGQVVDEASWLIRPSLGFDEFSYWNTRIHGIEPQHVVDAPEWAEQLPDMVAFLEKDVLAAHNAGFDMGVIRGASEAHRVAVPAHRYLCTVQLARRTYHLDSYRLPVAAMAAGFEDFSHHDALDDARACAAIVVHAARRHGATTVDELVEYSGIRMRELGTAVPDVVGGDADSWVA